MARLLSGNIDRKNPVLQREDRDKPASCPAVVRSSFDAPCLFGSVSGHPMLHDDRWKCRNWRDCPKAPGLHMQGRFNGMRNMLKIDRVQGHTFISSVIDGGSLVVDLGMNKGSFSAGMRRKYGCGILGVEANPKLARDLVEQNVECINAAVSSASGLVEFFVDAENSEASSLTPVQASELESVQIEAITLADLLVQREIQEVDLLKIDIEGAEIDLLLHCDPEVIGRMKQICVEFHIFLHAEHRSLVEDIVRHMHAVGFQAIDFSRNFEDVLFVNKRFIPLSTFDSLSISAQKYSSGVSRMMHRKMSDVLELGSGLLGGKASRSA